MLRGSSGKQHIHGSGIIENLREKVIIKGTELVPLSLSSPFLSADSLISARCWKF